MQATLAPRGDAQTFLTHFVGGGLEDDRCVIQRFVSRADGEVVPVHPGDTARKGGRKARGTIVTAKAVEKMRGAPAGPLQADTTCPVRGALPVR